MSSLSRLLDAYPMALGLPPAKLLCRTARLNLRALTVALLVALAGCATSERTSDPPPVLIAQSTWRQVDRDLLVASRAATGPAENYARERMASWRILVQQHTEAEFIPWFTSYWTRQWLTMKVAWYKLSTGKETEPVENRLAIYLQKQYHGRVLSPVAKQIDPDVVMQQATKTYVQLLGQQLQGISQRYGIPREQFDRRLKDIPAIALTSPGVHRASLYQIVRADPLDRLPAYVALIDRLRNAEGGVERGSSEAGISSLAQRTSEKLAADLATSGAASAVSAVVGRAAGMMISLGVAGFTAIARENERPALEAQLRGNLNAAFDEEWLSLMENPATGVLAGVYHIAGQLEVSLAEAATRPAKFEALPRGVPRPGAQPQRGGEAGYDAPPGYPRTNR